MSHYFKKETSFFGNRIMNAQNLVPGHIVTSTVACFEHRLAELNFTL